MIIEFNKTEHSYKGIIGGRDYDLLNASKFKEKYKREFDSFAVSGQLAKKGKTSQLDIMRGWNMKGKIHREYGTAMHATLEGYIKYRVIPDDKYLEYFLRAFDSLVSKQFKLKTSNLSSEVISGNEELLIGGIVDVDSEKIIFDLKTGNFKKKKKGNLIAPFNFLPNNPVGEATLQLNFYRLFEGNEDKKLVVLYWDGQKFEVINIKRFTDEQMDILGEEIKSKINL